MNERLLADDKALELLRVQLQEIVRVVLAPVVAKLREVAHNKTSLLTRLM